MVSTCDKETYYWCWLKYGKYMGQRDLLLVLAQMRSVHGAKRPATGAGSNTVSTSGKETYYLCWLKYGIVMGQRNLLLVLAQIR